MLKVKEREESGMTFNSSLSNLLNEVAFFKEV